jgi:hypothetical protein
MAVNVRITYEVALTDSDDLENLADSAFTHRAHNALMDYMFKMRLMGGGLIPFDSDYGDGVDAILTFPNKTVIKKG